MSNELQDDTVDVAESFVTTFYHDSGDEMSTDEGHGDIFELYGNSRPITPLKHNVPEGTTANRAHNSDDPPDQISVIETTKTFHEKNQRFKTDTNMLEPSVESNGSVEEKNVVPTSPSKLVPENEAALKVHRIHSSGSDYTLTELSGNLSQKSAEESTPPEDD